MHLYLDSKIDFEYLNSEPHKFRDAMAMVTERSISGNLAQFNAANVKFNYHINLCR